MYDGIYKSAGWTQFLVGPDLSIGLIFPTRPLEPGLPILSAPWVELQFPNPTLLPTTLRMSFWSLLLYTLCSLCLLQSLNALLLRLQNPRIF